MPTVTAKALGRRRPLVPIFDVPPPPDFPSGGGRMRLRDLIAMVVRFEVQAFRERQSRHKLIQVLSAEQIETGAERGKISMGGRDLKQTVDEDQAVGAALQAFEDGIYLVFIDEVEQQELDAEVFVKPDSALLFVRLALLAGG